MSTSWPSGNSCGRAAGTGRSKSTSGRRRSTNFARPARRWASRTSPRVRSCALRIGPVNSFWRKSSGPGNRLGRGEGTTEEELLRIVELDGTYDSKREPKLSPAALKEAYRYLVMVRILDDRMLSLQRQGRIGFYVPSKGEEACQVGSAMALGNRDLVFPPYPEPGCAFVPGAPH